MEKRKLSKDLAKTSDARHELAETVSHQKESEEQLAQDETLLKALLMGAHIENAAASAGISTRTAYRRLANPEFREKLEAGKEALRDSIVAKLSEAAGAAISKLWELLEDDDPRIQIDAAKTIIQNLTKLQKTSASPPITIQYEFGEVLKKPK